MPGYKLIAFKFCPYAQRLIIGLEERGLPYEVEHIEPDNKPAWFLEISPLGKVPLLRVGDRAVLFESVAITEYLEEVGGHRLYPEDPVERARHRAWLEFAAGLTPETGVLALAGEARRARQQALVLQEKLGRLDDEVVGPFFAGDGLSNVDAVAAPALQRLSWLQEREPSLALFDEVPRVAAWRDRLLARPSVQRSTVPEIRQLYLGMLARRGSWIGRRPSS
jgi:glutathione S-transferase